MDFRKDRRARQSRGGGSGAGGGGGTKMAIEEGGTRKHDVAGVPVFAGRKQ